MVDELSVTALPQDGTKSRLQPANIVTAGGQRLVESDNSCALELTENNALGEQEQGREHMTAAVHQPSKIVDEAATEVSKTPVTESDHSCNQIDWLCIENSPHAHPLDKILGSDEPEWGGWAEIENDPAIFTIILQEWGLHHVRMNDVYDMADILLAEDDVELLGLILLSEWLPLSERKATSPATTLENNGSDHPWFANQISKFSCGTVALLNVVLNSNLASSETPILDELRQACFDKSAKDKGLLIDSHHTLRATHNSFATLLDRKIVDMMLKADAQADMKRRKHADGDGRKKRSKRSAFSRRKIKTHPDDDDEENGYHFVAYVEHGGCLWQLDGTEKHPQKLGKVPDTSTWRSLAAEHITAQTIEAREQGSDYSLMSVTRQTRVASDDLVTKQEQRGEQYTSHRERRQDDWAPFIECLLRIHAERGDLNTMLGV